MTKRDFKVNDLVRITDVVVAQQPHGVRLQRRLAVVVGFENRDSIHGSTWLQLCVKSFPELITLPPSFVTFEAENQGELVVLWNQK